MRPMSVFFNEASSGFLMQFIARGNPVTLNVKGTAIKELVY